MTFQGVPRAGLMVRSAEVIPAAAMALSVTAVLCAAQLLPFGRTMLLVRVSQPGIATALADASLADAALVGIPAPGFAVLYGEASRVRQALGLAVAWKGKASCSAP